MKALIILFLAWSFCSNIVASYDQFMDYRQGSYQPQNDWPQNQYFSQNPNSDFIRQPVADSQQTSPQSNDAQFERTLHSQRQIIERENSAQNQTEILLTELPADHTQRLAPPERNYGVALQPWQNAPPNRLYSHDSYPAPVPQVQSSWPAHNLYSSVSPNLQEHYPSRPAFTHWQNVPPPYYDNLYNDQIIYNNQAPVAQPPVVVVSAAQLPPRHRPPHPLPAPAPRPLPPPEPAPTLEMEQKLNNVREILAKKQEVKDYLKSESTKKRFLPRHPKDNVEQVDDVIDDSSLDNSQHLKTSDTLPEQDKNQNSQESKKIKYHPVHKLIHPSTPLPDKLENQNIHSEPSYNIDQTLPQPNNNNNPQDTKPLNWPINVESTKIPNPKFNLYRHKKPHWVVNTNSPVDKPVTNSDLYNPSSNKPHENPNINIDKNNSPSNDWNIHEPPVNEHKSVYQPIDTANFEGFIIPSTKPLETNNHYRKPSFDQAPIHPKHPKIKHPVPHQLVNEHSNHKNHPINKYTDNLAPINEQNVQNPSGINYPEYENPVNFEPKNKDTIPVLYTTTEAPDALLEDTEKPYHYTGPSFIPPNSYDTGTFAPPLSKDYERLIFELNNQAQSSDVLDSNDKTSSIVQSYPGNENPTSGKGTDDGFTSNDPVIEQEDKVYDDDDIGADKPEKPIDSYTPSISEIPYHKGNISPISDVNREEASLNTGYPADDVAEIPVGKDQEKEESKGENVIYQVEQSNTEQQELGENEVAVADLDDLKKVDKSIFWHRPTEEFWDKLYSEAETGGYDRLFVFNVKVVDPIIEKSTKSYVFENGTTMEETTEIHWENKEDELPKEIRIIKIIKNPGPELALPKRLRFKPITDATDAPNCE